MRKLLQKIRFNPQPDDFQFVGRLMLGCGAFISVMDCVEGKPFSILIEDAVLYFGLAWYLMWNNNSSADEQLGVKQA